MLSALLNLLFALAVFNLLAFFEVEPYYIKILFLISFVVIIISSSKMNKLSVFFIFLICILGLFYVGTIVSILFDWETTASRDAERLFALMTITGIHLMLSTYLIFFAVSGKKCSKISKITVDFTYSKNKLNFLFLIFCVSISVYLLLNFEMLVGTTRAEVKSTGVVGYFSYAMFFLAATYCFAGLLYRFERSNLRFLYLYYLLVSMIVAFIVFKTRTGLLLPLATFTFGYVFLANCVVIKSKNRYLVVRSINKIKLYIFSLFVFLFVVSMRFVRGLIETGSTDFNISIVLERTFNGGDLGYGVMSTKVIDYVIQNDISLEGQSYLRLFYLFLPRSLWEDKPSSTQRLVGEWLMPNVANMTIPPGFFADAYINFGIFGLVIFLYFGFFFALLDIACKSRINYLIYISFSFTFLFHLARGAFLNPLVGAAVSLVGAAILIRLFKIKELKSNG